MIKYPLFFEVNVQSESGVSYPFDASAANLPPITCAIPPEFKGPGGGYSPEDLFAMAVISCLVATFKVFAEKAKLQYTGISATAKLTIDRNIQGIPEFKKLDMIFTFTGVQDQEKAKTIFAESEKYCLVSNSIKTEKTFSYQFA